ncbi:MAG: hypothetical protein KJ667_02565 [Alphaproteobacteria bacterium]|nr:hypothetical protein [Alphaproteobacteria bacterium]
MKILSQYWGKGASRRCFAFMPRIVFLTDFNGGEPGGGTDHNCRLAIISRHKASRDKPLYRNGQKHEKHQGHTARMYTQSIHRDTDLKGFQSGVNAQIIDIIIFCEKGVNSMTQLALYCRSAFAQFLCLYLLSLSANNNRSFSWPLKGISHRLLVRRCCFYC